MQLNVLAYGQVGGSAGIFLGDIGDGSELVRMSRPLGMRMRTMKNGSALPSPFFRRSLQRRRLVCTHPTSGNKYPATRE